MTWRPATDPDVTPPEGVASTEPLARSVHSKEHFRKGKTADEQDFVKFRAFEPPKVKPSSEERIREISVDRCLYLAEQRAIELGEWRADKRDLSFYGWAIIPTSDATRLTDGVEASFAAEEQNHAHADILLPIRTTTNKKDRNNLLVDLAASSWWLGHSPGESDSESAEPET